MRKILRFLGWIDRKPGDMWPFPFAGLEPPHPLTNWTQKRCRK